ncbi:2-succinyl-6-hydroxy-2,4-cyclohexadiene-1-carboxylate synthase [Sporosarcina newyorkensis 2681]|uniref:Putative 2-succinyl-6-hydroxy-2,4-cyclohexadiene-1-carboxylate synthase n=1 Tax=Sporosarcina newyorkensis 2681 TaxID=1027292 RepID=F9DWW6_9BACL|nr:2-succinyl-6-hydroxy-2,4-cyclohexadiene-1-carboxylate synthase [Sporosarcina newyorkensis]EGQ21475.1 2-succinyl-6-hydroxy-2,4-cyclohexadiene-1-carboxylate synthase [Sporosarcina newyorkensis 2681]
MKAEVMDIRGIQTYVERHGDEQLPAIVLLHGFTGSTDTWRETIDILLTQHHVITVDLIGHGRTASPTEPERYQMNEQIEDLHQLLADLHIEQPILLGYSMGGRVALGYAATYSDQIAGLILESSSPGLGTEAERTTRCVADAKLAERIENEGIEKFIDFWQEIPLFHSQKKLSDEKQLAVRLERLKQQPLGLANSLRGIGTGRQPSYWDELTHFEFPVLLITGSEDEKFENIAREMKRLLPNALHETIKDAGHAIHVEKPRQFATMIKSYLKTVGK